MIILSRDPSTTWDAKAYQAAVRQAVWALSLRVCAALLVIAATVELATEMPTGIVVTTLIPAAAMFVIAKVMIRRAHPDHFTDAARQAPGSSAAKSSHG